jgi:hypothetical protein
MKVITIRSTAEMARYWLLNELRLTRARARVGTITELNARRDRRALQKALLRLRATRKVST